MHNNGLKELAKNTKYIEFECCAYFNGTGKNFFMNCYIFVVYYYVAKCFKHITTFLLYSATSDLTDREK